MLVPLPMEPLQQSEVSSVLRPLSTGELLDRAFNLFRNHFVLFFAIGLLPRTVAFAEVIAIRFLSQSVAGSFGERSISLFAVWILSLPVEMMALAISHAMTMQVVSNAYLQRPIPLGEAYRRAKPYFGTLFWLAFQTTIRILLGFVLLVVPGVYLTLCYSVSVPAAVFENLRASEALGRSKDLTEDHRGRVFGLYFLFGLISYIVSAAANYLIRSNHSGLTGTVLVELIKFVPSTVTTPILLIVFALLYYDLRVRKEAFDLQFMMASLDAAKDQAEAARA